MSATIIEEYTTMVNRLHFLENELEKLPQGYISKKTINYSVYFYLQSRNGRKIESRYLHKDEVANIEADIKKRKVYESELIEVRIRIKDLEKAAKIISKDLCRKLQLIKLCCGMDDLSSEEKNECASFATAMNAVEGVPISKNTQTDIELWKSGQIAFGTVFSNVLSRYGGRSDA